MGDHHPPHRLGSVCLRDQVFPEPGQPRLQPLRLDRREGHPVHPRRALVRTSQRIGVVQDVCAVNLVVEQVEA
ncbi:MAG: hypothetical protein M3O00_18270, partial [Pseudomonadota bacterium]|nr:hypothetical protein [Pseudomonadota bacterium]